MPGVTSKSESAPYKLCERIGKGSFATVYRGVDCHTGKDVAIKVIDKAVARQNRRVLSVRHEIEIHRTLNHPHIVELLDYFEDKNSVYIVLEYCQSHDLARTAWGRGMHSYADIRRYAQQLLQAVLYLNENKIVHRDLKLSNILMGECNTVKLADFGLATRIDSKGAPSDAESIESTLCGTPNFMAPEVLKRRVEDWAAAEVWSLGCILFTMFTGRPPFQADTIQSTLQRVTKGLTGESIPDWIPHMAANAIRSMCSLDPGQRPSLGELKSLPFFAGQTPLSVPVPRGKASPHSKDTAREDGTLQCTPTRDIPSKPVDSKSSTITPTSVRAMEDKLKPLDTKFLRAHRHPNKKFEIGILEDGSVYLTTRNNTDEKENCSSESESPNKKKGSTLTISSDGLRIKFESHATGQKREFHLDDLPSKLWPKYKYAAKFVRLLKSRTPAVIYYDAEGCKHILMACVEDYIRFESFVSPELKLVCNSSSCAVEVYRTGRFDQSYTQHRVIRVDGWQKTGPNGYECLTLDALPPVLDSDVKDGLQHTAKAMVLCLQMYAAASVAIGGQILTCGDRHHYVHKFQFLASSHDTTMDSRLSPSAAGLMHSPSASVCSHATTVYKTPTSGQRLNGTGGHTSRITLGALPLSSPQQGDDTAYHGASFRTPRSQDARHRAPPTKCTFLTLDGVEGKIWALQSPLIGAKSGAEVGMTLTLLFPDGRVLRLRKGKRTEVTAAMLTEGSLGKAPEFHTIDLKAPENGLFLKAVTQTPDLVKRLRTSTKGPVLTL